jgi:O-antigen/teichoic acid export membrane protein
MVILSKAYSQIMSVDVIQRQAIITFFWQIAFTFIGFLSTMYFAHTIGSSALGSYFLFVAYNGIFSLITDGGFGGAAVKRISEGEEPDTYFSAYFILRLVFTVIVALILVLFRPYFVDLNNSGMFIWLLLSLVVSIIAGPLSSGVAGRGKIGVRSTCAAIGSISSIIIQVIVIYFGYEAAGLAGGAVAGIFIAALIEFHFFDLHLTNFRWRHVKSLSKFSFWLFLTSSGAVVFSQADTIMIGYFMDTSNVGVYRIALQFTTVATFTTYALRNTLWPRVSRWGKKGEMKLVEESLSRAISYSLILAVPVLTGGTLLGDRLLYFFYGAEFARGYLTMVALLFVQLVNVFQYFFTMYMDALDKPQESFKVTFIGVIANVAFNAFLIPIMGISGAAIATLITMLINALLARHILSKFVYIRLERNSLISIMKSSLIMGLFVAIYRILIPLSNVWITLAAVFIGGVIYIISMLLLDRKVHDELKVIAIKVGFPWPNWL